MQDCHYYVIVFCIMTYVSTPHVGMILKKMVATLKVHKWHARNLYVRLVKGLHEPDQALSSAFMSNRTINFIEHGEQIASRLYTRLKYYHQITRK